jgi:hypothetical protein
MRKLLLGTTALVAAAGLSTAASAQTSEPIKMRMSGYYSAAAGYLITTDNAAGKAGEAHRRESFKQDTEVHFLGETKLDNGLIVGVHFEFEGQTQGSGTLGAATDQVDETWMYFKGNWGEVRFGDEDDARKLKAYVAPVADPGNTFGVNSPLLAFTNSPIGTNTTTVNIENDETKIIYFTPTIFGFSLAASYVPDGQSHASRSAQGAAGGGQFGAFGGNGGSTALTTNGTGSAINSQVWSVAGNYDGKFGDFTVGVGAGYTQGVPEGATAAAPRASDNSTATRAGGVIGFGPFKFGGSFEHSVGIVGSANSATSCIVGTGFTCRSTIWDVGGTYTIGPFTVGLAGSFGSYDHPAGFATIPNASNNQYAVTAHYVIGPGISLEGAVTHTDYGSGTSGPAPAGTGVGTPNHGIQTDYHDTAIMLGSRINF